MRSAPVAAVHDSIAGALYALLIGDALSMPVHWYYNPRDIDKDFGTIETYHAPKLVHPGSIMSLSSTGGGGRGSQKGSIIGDVINHGKKELWGRKGIHYHNGMAAGENTLNALCARQVVQSVTESDGVYDAERFLQRYVTFMTTPGSHNDTYAETYHRMFFANYARGVPARSCADDDDHNVASMGGLVTVPPVVLAAAMQRSEHSTDSSGKPVLKLSEAAMEAVKGIVADHVGLTHRSDKLKTYATLYAELMIEVLFGADLRSACVQLAKRLPGGGVDLVALIARGPADRDVIGRLFSPACYIDDSFRAMLYLAAKYADASPEVGMLANTNVGGENVHRGAVLGALLGCAHGASAVPASFKSGLHAATAIEAEVQAFVESVSRLHDE